MTDITGMGPVACGSHSYTVVSGSVHFVWRQKGTVDSNFLALTDGRATEDWTMLKVKVVDQAGRVHRVEGRQHVSAPGPPAAEHRPRPDRLLPPHG